jgi:hypothetical protein
VTDCRQRVLTRVSTEEGEDLYRLGTRDGRAPYPGTGNTDATRGHPEYQCWGRRGQLVPRIILDDGLVLWGPECWWWPVTAEQEAALGGTVSVAGEDGPS